MKAFRFRLESVLRWRAAQVSLEKERVAAAASRLDAIRSAIGLRKTWLSEGAASLTAGAAGDTLQSWAAWEKKCNREIAELETHARAAEKTLAEQLQRLVEANRNQELIVKLRESAFTSWQADLAKEVEALASEAFLRQVTIEKRTGA